MKNWLLPKGMTDDRRLLQLAGLALPATVWLLGLIVPPKGGLTPGYLLACTGLLVAFVAVDQTAPTAVTPLWRRLTWLAAELILSLLIVVEQGNVVRPALIYLLPTSRAILMFGVRSGMALSLLAWLALGINVLLSLGPNRLGESASYLSFFLAPYIVAVVLTVSALRQSADRQHLQSLYDELRRAHEELQALQQQARDAAVTQERNRLAREIHDSLAHYLTVINLQLEAAEKLGEDQISRALEQVRRARRLTLECLQEVRRSVAAMRASTLEELSLGLALDKLVVEFTETTGIQVQLDVAVPEGVAVAPETGMALYRVAQEGLTNVHRHAHASRVQLSVVVRNHEVALIIEDDGVGPAPGGETNHVGFGLLGLRERVELLGGYLVFENARPHGAQLAVSLPMGEPQRRV